MALLWRLQRYEEDFTNAANISTSDDVNSISWTRDLYGNCIEANINTVVSALGTTIGQRHIIVIQTNLDGAGWVSRFMGMVTQPGALRSPNPSTIKLVGLKAKLYKIKLDNAYYPEEDLYARINRVLSDSDYRAAGTTFTAGTTHLPGSSGGSFSLTLPAFVTGVMYVGDFLDAMAKATGKRWIVNANGQIIFGDITGSQSFTEGSSGVEVEYTVPDSEFLATQITFRIPSVNFPDAVLNDYYSVPLVSSREAVRPVFTRSSADTSHTDYKEDLIVEWDLGLPPYSRWAASSVTSTNVTDVSNAQDQDLDTFAVTTDDTLATIYQAQYSTRLLDGFYIKYTSTEDVKVIFENNNGTTTGTSPTAIEYLEFLLPTTDDAGEGKIFLIPHDPSFSLDGSTRWAQIRLSTVAGTLTLYEVYGVSIDGLTGILSKYYKTPIEEVAKIIQTSTTLLEPTPTINLTPSGGGSLSFTGGILKQTIDKDGGVVSEVQAGQEYDPDAEALNALEKYEFDRAQREANRFRLWR